jgi:hypothetical protein
MPCYDSQIPQNLLPPLYFSAHPHLGKEPEVKLLMAIHTGVKTLSDLLLRLLPDFWKLAVAFMDGKIQKVQLLTFFWLQRPLHKKQSSNEVFLAFSFDRPKRGARWSTHSV